MNVSLKVDGDNAGEGERLMTIPIELGVRHYDIHIGHNLWDNIVEYLPFSLKGQRVFILSDDNVAPLYAEKIADVLKANGAGAVQVMAVPAGEQSKNFSTLGQVINWMIEGGVTRQSVLFTVGGGVVGDLGGFAASIMMRGIPFVQVPTSLLAMVDSSVGGKTGIDIPQGKNLVGSFYQPETVIIDLDTLKTLPKRELLAGYAEIAKYGLINDPEFFIWLEHSGHKILALKPGAVRRAIETSCAKKAELVAMDEREKDQRALLNLGHTFGHALETAAGYDGRLLHGEAVAIGTVMAFTLSMRRGHCDEDDVLRIKDHFKALGIPTKISDIQPPLEASVDDLIDLMRRDKKATAAGLVFILAYGIGKSYISKDVEMEDVRGVIQSSLSK